MTGLTRTDLTAPQRATLSGLAFAGKGHYGAISALAQDFGVSRPTVYSAAAEAEDTLNRYYVGSDSRFRNVMVHVDEAQLRRTIVGLRCVGVNSIRAIEDLLPIIYPGVRTSFGKIQGICVEAEVKAAAFNAGADLSPIKAGALDEMFSQGYPVLAGICLDTGYLFSLALRDTRTAADWAEVLGVAKDQGLLLDVVVKDAAPGIAAGVRAVFPEAEQRDDSFHALYEMGKVRRVLERKAYGAIALEIRAEKDLDQVRRTGRGNRHELVAKLKKARRKCRLAIEQYDRYEQATREVAEAMEFVDINNAELSDSDRMMEQIAGAGKKMLALDHRRCRKVGRYIINRAPGLVLYMRALVDALEGLFPHHGEWPVRLATLIWRLSRELQNHRRPWERSDDERLLVSSVHRLRELAGDQADTVLAEVDKLLQRRHRASSAIEGFNAALRPYLYVHKGVTPGFLELFRAYYNLRTRRWGRYKGTSAHQLLGGNDTRDWLTRLGFPASNTTH